MSGIRHLAGWALLLGLSLTGGCGDGEHNAAGASAGAVATTTPTAPSTLKEMAVAPPAAHTAAPPMPTPHRAAPVTTGAPVAAIPPSVGAPIGDSSVESDITGFEQVFAREANDGGWATRTAARLRSVTSGSARYASISHDLVDCKQTLCKLALGYDDPRVFEDYVAALLEAMKDEPGGALEFDQHRELGGRWAVTAYLTRSVESTAPAR
jgi:hypothetical protein